MNNDIKEILEIFKQVDLDQDVGGCYNCPRKDKNKTCVGCLNNAKDKLLDYITNLQEELKYQKQAEQEYNEKHTKLMKKYKDYKSRNEKAIKELKQAYVNIENNGNVNYIHIAFRNDLLNILQGEDKDE